MGKFMDKIMDVLALSEEEEEEIVTEEEYTDDYSNNKYGRKVQSIDQGKKESYGYSKAPIRKNSKIVNIHTNIQMEVVVTSPETFEEAKEICKNIKDKKPVVINLQDIEHQTAQRITDFVCGACYALDGNIQRVTNQIFIIAPDNVDFAGDSNIRQSLETNGIIFPWTKEQ